MSHSFLKISLPNLQTVYGWEKMSVKNFVLILSNKMAIIAGCLKIINMF